MKKFSWIRRLCLLLVSAMVPGLLVGCGGGFSDSKPENTVPSTPMPSPMDTQAYNQARASSLIGIWYSIWYDLYASNSLWDDAGGEIFYRPLLPDGTYGKYASWDDEIIQFHLKEITDAQIDFIIMDQTNMVDNPRSNLNTSSIKMAKAITAWNQTEGNRKIRYCSAIGALATKDNMELLDSEAEKIYTRYVAHSSGRGSEENHLYVDGKPLLVVFNCYFTEQEWKEYQKTNATPYMDKFTVRFSTGHVFEGNYGQWGWVMPDGPQIDEDVAVMMPGWYKIGYTSPFVFRERGKSYESSWKTLLASEIVPKHVVINSFNEYAEHTAVFTAKTDLFPEDYEIEPWLDSSGEENPSLYWDMTKAYIEKFKNGDRN